jgi:phosphohistidine phosphatase
MRRLILVRHAKSSWDDPSLPDFDRPLAKRGRRGAALVGAWLGREGYRPEVALASSSRRTRETWDVLAEALGAAPAHRLPDLYEAGAETMLAVLRAAPDVECLLMLGHNPGIADFARRLLAEPPDDAAFAKFVTAATAVIDFDIGAWEEAGWNAGRLRAFTYPKALQ